MNDNPQNRGEVARTDSTSSQGAPTAPIQGNPPGYMPSSTQPPPPETGYSAWPPSAQWASPQQPAQQTHVRDRRPHHAPVVGPVLLIGAGVLFLLSNFGLLPANIWSSVAQLWPLVLIAIGIDLLLGRRNQALSLLLVLLVIGGGLALLVYNGGFRGGGDLVSASVNTPLHGAKSASVILNTGTGNLTLDGAASGESIATGTLQYFSGRGTPVQELSNSGDRATLSLRQADNSFNLGSLFGPSRTPEWNLHLNPAIPMTLNANLGTGNSNLDLSQLKVTSVDIHSGTGNTTISFPANAGSVAGTLDGGVGNLSLKIPDGVEAQIAVNTGIGNINADSRFTKQADKVYITNGYTQAKNKLDLSLDVGVGNVEISR